MNFPPEHILTFHTNSERLISTTVACFQPVYNAEEFTYSSLLEPFTLQLFCKKWGDIGKMVFIEMPANQTILRFKPPQTVTSDVALRYKEVLQTECLGPKGRLAEMLGEEGIFIATLSQALYEKRLERQQTFITWLINTLQIFGIRQQPSNLKLYLAELISEQFVFPIKGTPAQFVVMIAQLIQVLQNQPEYNNLKFQSFIAGTKESTYIPPTANPVEVKISQKKNQISIHAHLLPAEKTLLHVHLNGEKNLWLLWDKIRDELEKLGWFSLPEILEQNASKENKSVPQQQEVTTFTETWMNIPDIGANRDIVRLWHQGLTCAQIAARVGLNEKTILNRINQLRKIYGVQIIPYRKSNLIKKSKDQSS
jgi:hypothetical protein